MSRLPARAPLFPYTTLFRSSFLLAVIDGGGTLPPALGLGGELVRRGHAVTVLGDPTVEGSANAAGCDFIPWDAAPHFDSIDRKSTRLNSSHSQISYADFCLK